MTSVVERTSTPPHLRTEITPVPIGEHQVGPGQPVYVIGEIGINHNGDVEIAKKLIDVAAEAGCQAVKFQKRTPEICVPLEQQQRMRQTPWGEMTYLDYKHRVELGRDEYTEITKYCAELGLDWFASPWDVPSVEFLEEMEVPAHKVASASITDLELLRALAETGKPILLSTGMSTLEEIDAAVTVLGARRLVIMHSTSTYPMPPEEGNLRTIETLRERYRVPVGFGPRAGAADLGGGHRAGRGHGGTAHHPGPHHVGIGPLGVPGTHRPEQPGPRHPGDPGCPGRRRQTRLPGRGGAPQAPPPHH